jgi:hypothetical protein
MSQGESSAFVDLFPVEPRFPFAPENAVYGHIEEVVVEPFRLSLSDVGDFGRPVKKVPPRPPPSKDVEPMKVFQS